MQTPPWRLSAMMFLQFLIWGSWMVTLGAYMLESLSFSGRQVGIVYGSTAIAATISPFWVGLAADRWFNLEKLLASLHFLGAFCLLGASLVTEFGWFYFFIQLNSLFFLPTFSLSNAFCFHHLQDAGKKFPRVRVWGTLAWILVGLSLSYWSLETSSLQLRIGAAAGFLLSAYCLTLPATPPQPGRGRSARGFFSEDMRKLVKDPSLSVLFVALILCCLPNAYYYSFVTPYLRDIGVRNPAGLMTLGQVSEAIVMLLMPWALSRISFRKLIFIGLLCWGVRYVMIALGHPEQAPWWLYAGIGLHGIAYGWSALAAQMYLDTRVPVHLRSTAQGFVSFLTLGSGALIGAYLAGETVNLHSLTDGSRQWHLIWLYPAIIGTAVAVWFLWKFRGSDSRAMTMENRRL
jgi:nucleoside transporter